MKLTRCDNCGKEAANNADWIRIETPYWPDPPGGYLVSPGTTTYEVCSVRCAITVLEKK